MISSPPPLQENAQLKTKFLSGLPVEQSPFCSSPRKRPPQGLSQALFFAPDLRGCEQTSDGNDGACKRGTSPVEARTGHRTDPTEWRSEKHKSWNTYKMDNVGAGFGAMSHCAWILNTTWKDSLLNQVVGACAIFVAYLLTAATVIPAMDEKTVMQRLRLLVGARGFEPPTPWSRTRCSTRLSHAPTRSNEDDRNRDAEGLKGQRARIPLKSIAPAGGLAGRR